MEIMQVVEILHKDYERNRAEGCLDRAIILFCAMKNNGLNPKIEHFYYKQVDGKEYTHHFVVLENEVYDCNEEVTPTYVLEYKKRKERSHPELRWGNSNTLIRDNYLVSDLLFYSERFDEAFRNYLEENSRWLLA